MFITSFILIRSKIRIRTEYPELGLGTYLCWLFIIPIFWHF